MKYRKLKTNIELGMSIEACKLAALEDTISKHIAAIKHDYGGSNYTIQRFYNALKDKGYSPKGNEDIFDLDINGSTLHFIRNRMYWNHFSDFGAKIYEQDFGRQTLHSALDFIEKIPAIEDECTKLFAYIDEHYEVLKLSLSKKVKQQTIDHNIAKAVFSDILEGKDCRYTFEDLQNCVKAEVTLKNKKRAVFKVKYEDVINETEKIRDIVDQTIGLMLQSMANIKLK